MLSALGRAQPARSRAARLLAAARWAFLPPGPSHAERPRRPRLRQGTAGQPRAALYGETQGRLGAAPATGRPFDLGKIGRASGLVTLGATRPAVSSTQAACRAHPASQPPAPSGGVLMKPRALRGAGLFLADSQSVSAAVALGSMPSPSRRKAAKLRSWRVSILRQRPFTSGLSRRRTRAPRKRRPCCPRLPHAPATLAPKGLGAANLLIVACETP
jgi:hypothetical protein